LVHGLKLKKRTDFSKRRARAHHWNKGHLLVELLAETNKESIDEGSIFNRIAELPKFIADSLDLLAEDGDGGVPLSDRAELGVEGIDAGVAVVLKELLKRGP
jgi:hypothetical protein